MRRTTEGAADAQGREGESCELHIGDDEKDLSLEKRMNVV
jgi:hypothetical protein